MSTRPTNAPIAMPAIAPPLRSEPLSDAWIAGATPAVLEGLPALEAAEPSCRSVDMEYLLEDERAEERREEDAEPAAVLERLVGRRDVLDVRAWLRDADLDAFARVWADVLALLREVSCEDALERARRTIF